MRSSSVAAPFGSISASRNGRSFLSRNDAHVSIALFVRMFSLQSFSQDARRRSRSASRSRSFSFSSASAFSMSASILSTSTFAISSSCVRSCAMPSASSSFSSSSSEGTAFSSISFTSAETSGRYFAAISLESSTALRLSLSAIFSPFSKNSFDILSDIDCAFSLNEARCSSISG